MRFSAIKVAAVAALAICSDSVLGQLSPAQVVANIDGLRIKSQALIQPAREISLFNAPLFVIGQGPLPKLVVGFLDIVATATRAIGQMRTMPPVPSGRPSDAIFEAFRVFVRVHQDLLNTIIGKAGFLTRFPIVGPPVAAVLRQVERVVDTIAFGLIDKVQGRTSDFRNEAGKLKGTITIAIDSFDGISLQKEMSDSDNETDRVDAANMGPSSAAPVAVAAVETSA